MRISDWSSDVCSSDLGVERIDADIGTAQQGEAERPGGADGEGIARQLVRAAHADEENLAQQDIDRNDEGRDQHQGAAEPDGVAGDAVGEAEPAVEQDGHGGQSRSEEHTSELQSLMRSSYAVFCLKKK